MSLRSSVKKPRHESHVGGHALRLTASRPVRRGIPHESMRRQRIAPPGSCCARC